MAPNVRPRRPALLNFPQRRRKNVGNFRGKKSCCLEKDSRAITLPPSLPPPTPPPLPKNHPRPSRTPPDLARASLARKPVRSIEIDLAPRRAIPSFNALFLPPSPLPLPVISPSPRERGQTNAETCFFSPASTGLTVLLCQRLFRPARRPRRFRLFVILRPSV